MCSYLNWASFVEGSDLDILSFCAQGFRDWPCQAPPLFFHLLLSLGTDGGNLFWGIGTSAGPPGLPVAGSWCGRHEGQALALRIPSDPLCARRRRAGETGEPRNTALVLGSGLRDPCVLAGHSQDGSACVARGGECGRRGRLQQPHVEGPRPTRTVSCEHAPAGKAQVSLLVPLPASGSPCPIRPCVSWWRNLLLLCSLRPHLSPTGGALALMVSWPGGQPPIPVHGSHCLVCPLPPRPALDITCSGLVCASLSLLLAQLRPPALALASALTWLICPAECQVRTLFLHVTAPALQDPEQRRGGRGRLWTAGPTQVPAESRLPHLCQQQLRPTSRQDVGPGGLHSHSRQRAGAVRGSHGAVWSAGTLGLQGVSYPEPF